MAVVPEYMKKLLEEDSLKLIFEMQSALQERLGRMALSRACNMEEKCDMLKDDIFNLTEELHEMMRELPHKHWKNYSKELTEGWVDEEHRRRTLFEYVDAFHFFVNIGLILGFQPWEVANFYVVKNKINHQRQDNNY